MSQPNGGQGAPGGFNFDDVRKKLQMAQQGGQMAPGQDGSPQGQPVQPGAKNPTPPSAPTTMAAPTQAPMVMTATNPYDTPPQQAGGPPLSQANPNIQPRRAFGPQDDGGHILPAAKVEPGAPIGPEGGRRALGPESRPSPGNPSPNGPSRLQPGMPMKGVIGAPQGGGNQTPNWGQAQGAGQFQGGATAGLPQSNAPRQAVGPQPQMSQSDKSTLGMYGPRPQPGAPTNPYDSPTGKPSFAGGGAPGGAIQDPRGSGGGNPKPFPGWGESQPMPYEGGGAAQPQYGPGGQRRPVGPGGQGGGAGPSV